MYKGKRISVIIPALNEGASIAKVIDEIPERLADEVIIVDNGCADNTAAEAVRSGARVVKESVRGYGASCLRGLSEVHSPDIIVILDGDHSDFPDQMTRLVDPIANDEEDFVLGSRTLGHCEPGALTPQQYWGNKLAALLMKFFFGFAFTDMGPFRAIRFSDLQSMNMEDKNFGWNIEMQVKAIRHGLRIKEVPVDYRKRIGFSKISGTLSGTLKAGVKILYTIFLYLFKK